MKRRFSAISSLLIPILCLACARPGTDFPMERVNSIEEGVSRKQDVRRILGEPYSMSSDVDGSETWKYQHSVGKVTDTIRVKSVTITFDLEGIARIVHESRLRMRLDILETEKVPTSQNAESKLSV